MTIRWLILLAAVAVSIQDQETYDLIVYGGTAGGVITAVSGAREGLHVLLLEPGSHVGGMATSGLSRTDFGQKRVIGGYALEFYRRLGRKYQTERFGEDLAWYYEPHVGETVFREMLAEAGVDVRYGQRLAERHGVQMNGSNNRLTSVMTNGGSYTGKMFADCSYEGDLMAQAKVDYTWGRESAAQYGEPLAGVRDRTPFHQFLVPVSAYGPDGKLLPEVGAGPKGETGQADKKVQSYNFRLILTDDPANQIPFPKPQGYDPHRFELLGRLLKATSEAKGRPPKMGEVLSVLVIPNHKADINNNGAFSTDFIGGSWQYPEASYARRDQIWQAHADYTKGLLYYLAHDDHVPKTLRDEMNTWGLPKDEFQDSGYWPPQLYIREARRMVSDFVMTQKDLQTDLTKPDVIGMGSYNSDSHNLQRFARPDGNAENEGDMQVTVKPYQIPYRLITPRKSQAANLLVPVCFSASHVAYSSLRMEPQYMILGHAAGIAAALAIKGGLAVQDISVPALQEKLQAQAAVFQP
jgi:hypothetical protein